MKKILHIAAHMGGGAGKAIGGILKGMTKYQNTLLLLEPPHETKYLDMCKESCVRIEISSDIAEISRLASENDVIVLNWWCHPLSVNVLKALNGISARIILWSHVNGLCYPYLELDFLNKFNQCLFTSPCTYDNMNWTSCQKTCIKDKSEIVYGMGEFLPENSLHKKSYLIKEKCVIGYTGTLGYNKLNSEFPHICSLIYTKIKDVEFNLYGKYDESFKETVNADYINCKGMCGDIEKELTKMDIFCYPLAEENYATTENALIEAMAAGLPIVVLNNPAERCIITHNKTGLVAENISQFAEYVLLLYNDEHLRETLGRNARKSAIEKYSYKKNCDTFSHCIEHALESPEVKYSFNDILGDSVWDFFMYFCGDNISNINKLLNGQRHIRIPEIFFHDNKSSPQHYYKYFSYDNKIKKLSNILRMVKNENN